MWRFRGTCRHYDTLAMSFRSLHPRRPQPMPPVLHAKLKNASGADSLTVRFSTLDAWPSSASGMGGAGLFKSKRWVKCTTS